ncbi:MAG: hypothetical protein LBJ98_01540 [Endomicrobium sp.]|nr:hypothetical protein [Endomicrobium sp.]
MKKKIRQKYRLIYSEMRGVMPSREGENMLILLSFGAIILQVFGHRMNSCLAAAETCFCKCSENRSLHENGTERKSVLQADIKKAM